MKLSSCVTFGASFIGVFLGLGFGRTGKDLEVGTGLGAYSFFLYFVKISGPAGCQAGTGAWGGPMAANAEFLRCLLSCFVMGR